MQQLLHLFNSFEYVQSKCCPHFDDKLWMLFPYTYLLTSKEFHFNKMYEPFIVLLFNRYMVKFFKYSVSCLSHSLSCPLGVHTIQSDEKDKQFVSIIRPVSGGIDPSVGTFYRSTVSICLVFVSPNPHLSCLVVASKDKQTEKKKQLRLSVV